jgi:hypothetical protein
MFGSATTQGEWIEERRNRGGGKLTLGEKTPLLIVCVCEASPGWNRLHLETTVEITGDMSRRL